MATITERENPADALVVHEKHKDKQIETLPEGAVIGTSSLRRLAQLRHHFPHFEFKDVRGNLNTRLGKLDAGEYDALILAAAGLGRLGMAERIHQVIPKEISLHAVGQGALGIECLADNEKLISLLKAIEHPQTRDRCLAERAFLRELEGGCQVPIGVNTEINGDELTMTGIVASIDGTKRVQDTVSGSLSEPEKVGSQLAQCLREQGAQEILEEIFATLDRS